MWTTRVVRPLGLAAMLAVLGGCFIEGGIGVERRRQPTGFLTLGWLVAGRRDPMACSAFGAANLEIAIRDSSGAIVSTVDAPCSRFSARVELTEGQYSADVTLVDASSRAVTTTKPLSAIDIVAGTDLAITVDFPTGSRL